MHFAHSLIKGGSTLFIDCQTVTAAPIAVSTSWSTSGKHCHLLPHYYWRYAVWMLLFPPELWMLLQLLSKGSKENCRR